MAFNYESSHITNLSKSHYLNPNLLSTKQTIIQPISLVKPTTLNLKPIHVTYIPIVQENTWQNTNNNIVRSVYRPPPVVEVGRSFIPTDNSRITSSRFAYLQRPAPIISKIIQRPIIQSQPIVTTEIKSKQLETIKQEQKKEKPSKCKKILPWILVGLLTAGLLAATALLLLSKFRHQATSVDQPAEPQSSSPVPVVLLPSSNVPCIPSDTITCVTPMQSDPLRGPPITSPAIYTPFITQQSSTEPISSNLSWQYPTSFPPISHPSQTPIEIPAQTTAEIPVSPIQKPKQSSTLDSDQIMFLKTDHTNYMSLRHHKQ